MKLTAEEHRMLHGEQGLSVQKAMELLVAVGEASGADSLIKITYTHLVPPDLLLWTTGKLGEWIRDLTVKTVQDAGEFVVDTTLNPAIFDPDLLKRFGYPVWYTDEMKNSIAWGKNIYESLGVIPNYSCCPFLTLPPRRGQHLATAETNVVLYSNSVIGAMTNRESGATALASALTGRTPLYGMHLPENRLGQMLVDLKDDLRIEDFTYADYSVLSYYVAGQAGDKIPVYRGIPDTISLQGLLYFSSSHSQLGNFAMWHAVGITPEATTLEMAFGGKKPAAHVEIGKKEIRDTTEALSSAQEAEVDWVLFGCPHATLEHIKMIASLLAGKKLHDRAKLIIGTSGPLHDLAQQMGYVSAIEEAGGFVVSGICTNQFPQRDVPPGYRIGVVATDRAGAAHMFKVMGLNVWFGSTEQCVNAAISGRWEVT